MKFVRNSMGIALAALVFSATHARAQQTELPVLQPPVGYEEKSQTKLDEADVKDLEKFAKGSVEDLNEVLKLAEQVGDPLERRKLLKDCIVRISDGSRSLKSELILRNIPDRAIRIIELIESRVKGDFLGKGVLDFEIHLITESLNMDLSYWSPYLKASGPAQMRYAEFGVSYARLLTSAADDLRDAQVEFMVRSELLKLLAWDLNRDEGRAGPQQKAAILRIGALLNSRPDGSENAKELKKAYEDIAAQLGVTLNPPAPVATPIQETKKEPIDPGPQKQSRDSSVYQRLNGYHGDCKDFHITETGATEIAKFVNERSIDLESFLKAYSTFCDYKKAVALSRESLAGKLDVAALIEAYNTDHESYDAALSYARGLKAGKRDPIAFKKANKYQAGKGCDKWITLTGANGISTMSANHELDVDTVLKAFGTVCDFDNAVALAKEAKAGSGDRADNVLNLFHLVGNYEKAVILTSETSSGNIDYAAFLEAYGTDHDSFDSALDYARGLKAGKRDPVAFKKANKYQSGKDCGSWITLTGANGIATLSANHELDVDTALKAFSLVCNYEKAVALAKEVRAGTLDYDSFALAYSSDHDKYKEALEFGHSVKAGGRDLLAFRIANKYQAGKGCDKWITTTGADEISVMSARHEIDADIAVKAFSTVCDYNKAVALAKEVKAGKLDWDAFAEAYASDHEYYDSALEYGRGVRAGTRDPAVFKRLNGYKAKKACGTSITVKGASDMSALVKKKTINIDAFLKAFSDLCDYDSALKSISARPAAP